MLFRVNLVAKNGKIPPLRERTTSRRMLNDSLKKGFLGILLTPGLQQKTYTKACQIETCLYQKYYVFNPEIYHQSIRMISRYLSKNVQRFMSLDASFIASMDAAELYSSNIKDEPFIIEDKKQEVVHGEIKCRYCGKYTVDYVTGQTRGGDESRIYFIYVTLTSKIRSFTIVFPV
jgi:hypothetical protein